MKQNVVAYDSAYPGSMCERENGRYIDRDDQNSLAAALVELIASRDREIEDLRYVLAIEKQDAARYLKLRNRMENTSEILGVVRDVEGTDFEVSYIEGKELDDMIDLAIAKESSK